MWETSLRVAGGGGHPSLFHGRPTLGTHRYRITISGRLGAIGREVFAGFDIMSDSHAIVLGGELDQAALHGVLNRIQALGLELVGVVRLG